jgi:hypothetical protein
MHAIPHYGNDFRDWRSESEKRLRISMLLSAALLAALLSLAKMPAPREVLPLIELVVELTISEPQEAPEPALLPPPVTEPLAPTAPVEPVTPAETPATEAPPASTEPAAEDGPTGTDWDAIRDEVIKAIFDAIEREEHYTINPAFERVRREAVVRFRASLAPDAVEAWERVETDQIGRTLLRLGDGDCYVVLDDPSAVNRWVHETFQQGMVFCELYLGGRDGRNLPWVEIIRERYPYLQGPVEMP